MLEKDYISIIIWVCKLKPGYDWDRVFDKKLWLKRSIIVSQVVAYSTVLTTRKSTTQIHSLKALMEALMQIVGALLRVAKKILIYHRQQRIESKKAVTLQQYSLDFALDLFTFSRPKRKNSSS